MRSSEIRQQFFDFFKEKQHKIVPSAPIVVKNDPTLMFTNAGMNQFKDYFLGTKNPEVTRIADTQKCLRVSGKHNDLEEVGRDSYHHTMFEMLGNWSFGDYFKKEAISWAWEFLTDRMGINKEDLYASVFEGDTTEGLDKDTEASSLWSAYLPEERILAFDKKDNFWEMGETGPCGPCSEIHVDLRSAEEKKEIPGKDLVNMDHPQVVEVWNLVFIQYNRKADGKLEELPQKHVDTGMGFERLCMAIQRKRSNYDTDVFSPFLKFIEKESGIKYTSSYAEGADTDIAMRVIADHVRAVSFAIADGQLPASNGAGYVIRRILRRAVRYYYAFLNISEPFLHRMVDLLAAEMGAVFPELSAQKSFIEKVILEEEKSFLQTLAGGLKRLDQLSVENNTLDGRSAFELYDTYGFPIDLTRLIATEKGWTVDDAGFETALSEQRNRAKADAQREAGDWNIWKEENAVEFIGYDFLTMDGAHVLRSREVVHKGKSSYHLVLSKTAFYAEGGGQVGDTGNLTVGGETIKVLNTQKENDLIIHVVDKLPADIEGVVSGSVHNRKRKLTENNHTATHLLHAALRSVLGDHVQQKGSLVKEDYLRFDFSHFQKVSEEELSQVEHMVNRKIRENISLEEDRSIPIGEAQEKGAMMLFGEKYGDKVRMITFDPSYSRELCGGCHVSNTGSIGLFKIRSEGAIAAGVRRIEAVTADGAEAYVQGEMNELNSIRGLFKNSTQLEKQVESLISDNKNLRREVESLQALKAQSLKGDLVASAKEINGVKVVNGVVSDVDGKSAKTLVNNILTDIGSGVVVLGVNNDGKPQLHVCVSKDLTERYNAGTIIRQLASHIQGGGGGQPFYASAGGKNVDGLKAAVTEIETII